MKNLMKLHKLELPEIILIELPVFKDSRGYFLERFHKEKFEVAGLPTNFVQDNHSKSAPNVLRGLHYQAAPAPQGKLVGVTQGKIWDVAVDIRKNSPNFGKYCAAELSDENNCLLWIPPGFAHGFCVLGEQTADVLYKCTALYHPTAEGGIRWDDPTANIKWPIKNPLLSPRDEKQPLLSELKDLQF